MAGRWALDSVKCIVPCALPVAMLPAMPVVTQATQPTQPASVVGTMPTLLARELCYDNPLPNVMNPYTTALGYAAQSPKLTTVANVEVRTSLLLRNLPDGITRG